VTVTDPDTGDTPTWTWDLDDDGTFGEAAGMASHTVAMGTTDGDGMIRVGVEATDGSETAQAYATVSVLNVEPSFTSSPGTTAFIRSEYRYEVAVSDPGGTNDPIEYRLTSRPMGMEIAANIITWTPVPEQRGRVFPVILRADDGDGAEIVQMWDITVTANQAPTTPVPVSPIERARVAADMPVTLVVENATDPDGDPIDYFFRLSRTSGFDTADIIGSGGVAPGSGETTEWTTDEPLDPGLWYWQVWVEDERESSMRTFAQFVVGDGGFPDIDAGGGGLTDGGTIPGVDAGTGGDDGGCAISATGSSQNGAPWLLGLVGAVLALRRKRR
jgi:MYXO-CTERM domain-containing protein